MPQFSDVCGVILAGGESLRMGRDKAMLEIGGRPIIRNLADKLQYLTDEVLVSANDRERYSFLGLPIVSDVFPGQGPLAGLHAAMNHSARPLFLIVACDMPGIQTALLRKLVESGVGLDALIPVTSDGQAHPLCALYRRTCLPFAEDSLAKGLNKLISLLGEPSLKVRLFDSKSAGFHDDNLANINSMSDLEDFLRSDPASILP